MDAFKPLLAFTVEDTAKLSYPLYFSPKLDGIRAVNLGNGCVSRNLKLIPNKHVQTLFGGSEFKWLDGELICGSPTDKDCYRNTNSAVMSQDGTPDVKLFLFDHFEFPGEAFPDRLKKIPEGLPNVVIVPQVFVRDEGELLTLEERWLAEGYEGGMVRSCSGNYKQGRATAKGGQLGKVKRFTDAEAQIIGFEELMSNQNEATVDALGHTERSSHQAGLVPMGTLGALIVKDYLTDVEFKVGTGFDAETRKKMWSAQGELVGQIIKYKSFAIGVKDKPRFPVFLGFRHAVDL